MTMNVRVTLRLLRLRIGSSPDENRNNGRCAVRCTCVNAFREFMLVDDSACSFDDKHGLVVDQVRIAALSEPVILAYRMT